MCHGYRNHNIEWTSVRKEECQASRARHVWKGKHQARRSCKCKYYLIHPGTKELGLSTLSYSLVTVLNHRHVPRAILNWKEETSPYLWEMHKDMFPQAPRFSKLFCICLLSDFLFLFLHFFHFKLFIEWKALRSQQKIPSEEQRTKWSQKAVSR